MTNIPGFLPKEADMSRADPLRTAIVAYEGVSLLDLSGPLEAFHIASTHPNHVGATHPVDASGGSSLQLATSTV